MTVFAHPLMRSSPSGGLTQDEHGSFTLSKWRNFFAPRIEGYSVQSSAQPTWMNYLLNQLLDMFTFETLRARQAE